MFTTLIYQPLLNVTLLLYGSVGFGDLGLTIILMTVLVRVVMLPLSLRSARSQRAMAQLAPEIERVKEQYKGDTSAQSEAVMKLYKERGVNPLAGCLPLVIQFPLLIGLYKVFLGVFQPGALDLLYGWVARPEAINTVSFGFLNVGQPGHILAVVAGALQFVQARLSLASQPQTTQSSAMTTQMMYFLPLIIVVIGWRMPAGLALYWIVTTVFSIGEQLYLKRR